MDVHAGPDRVRFSLALAARHDGDVMELLLKTKSVDDTHFIAINYNIIVLLLKLMIRMFVYEKPSTAE